jgi:hypothetical protein
MSINAGDAVRYIYAVKDLLYYGMVTSIREDNYYVSWFGNGKVTQGCCKEKHLEKVNINLDHLRLVNGSRNYVKNLTKRMLCLLR